MNDFVQKFISFDSYFSKYKGLLGERFATFKIALNILLQTKGKNIVETGTTRKLDGGWIGDGNSTVVFGEFAYLFDKHLFSCDKDPKAIDICKTRTRQYANHITYICEDSIEFLSNFNKKIDLLYLDSLDCPPEGDASIAQKHNLSELKTAYQKISNKGVVLIDDNLFKNGGKSALSKEYLINKGWVCIYDWYQSLWIRK